MAPFLYRCPNTGQQVQGFVADGSTERDDENYEAITCPACTRVHLVNPTNGRVLGVEDE